MRFFYLLSVLFRKDRVLLQSQRFNEIAPDSTWLILSARISDDDGNLGASTASTSQQQQQQAVIAAAYRAEQLAALEAQRQLERAQRYITFFLPALPKTRSDGCRAAVEAVVGRHSHQQRAPSGRASTSSNDSDMPPVKRGRASSGIGDDTAATAPINPMERLFGGMSSAHLKITSMSLNQIAVTR